MFIVNECLKTVSLISILIFIKHLNYFDPLSTALPELEIQSVRNKFHTIRLTTHVQTSPQGMKNESHIKKICFYLF